MTCHVSSLVAAAASLAAAMTALALSQPATARGQAAVRELPPRLAEYVGRHAQLTPEQRSQLLQGQPTMRLLEADPSSEVAVFGAVWIAAPVARYLAAVRDIENFEKGENFAVTKRISSPPRLEDFAELRLPREDLEDLETCRVGDCEIKLGESALLRVRKEVDWSKPTAASDVEQLTRRLALDYVNGYLEGGNARLAVYRDVGRPTFVAQEFASMIDRMPSLTEYLPEIRQYLLEFPRTNLPHSESFLYWQEAVFGLKPTIRISHLTVVERPTHAAVVSKMLYASHYFWTALELRVLVPDPARGDGFWFVSVNRSRSDGLSGFTGSLIRGKVRGEAEKGMRVALVATKAKMEGP